MTERGTPIAKIVPVAAQTAALPASLAALEQAGLVKRGSGRVPDEVWTLPPPQGSPWAWATGAGGGARDGAMKFWDASAIVPLCLDEPWTRWLTQVLAEDPLMMVWWSSLVECWSAFARLRREGLFDTSDEEHAREILARLATAWTEIVPSQAVRNHAAHTLQWHPLRAADGLQLARRSCGSRVSRLDSLLSAWTIGYGLLPSVKAFCSSHLRNFYKRPRYPSVSEGEVPRSVRKRAVFCDGAFLTQNNTVGLH